MTMSRRALPPVPGQEPVSVDFFLPTGIMIPMTVSPLSTLKEIKEQMYREARRYPLFSLLKNGGFYNFLGISSDGEKEEYLNEKAQWGDLDIAIPMLKLVERQGNQNEKLLNAEISNVIGRRLHDFDMMAKDSKEVQAFRHNMLTICAESVEARTSSDHRSLLYLYPPNLSSSGAAHEIDGMEMIEMEVYFTGTNNKTAKTRLKADLGSCPSEMVDRAKESKELKRVLSQHSSDDLALKVVGREEYLLAQKPLSCYKYVRECLAKECPARVCIRFLQDLIPVKKDEFITPVFSGDYIKLSQTATQTHAYASDSDYISIWDIKDTYKVKVLSAKNVNVPENQKVHVRTAIYHGCESICQPLCTSTGALADNASWNEILEFNIPVADLPRAAKLCFVIFGATENVRSKKEGRRRNKAKHISPVAWVNMTVFDFTSQLQGGRFTLYAWPIEEELEESVHYMGSTVLNPSTTECMCLVVDIIAPKLPSNVSTDRPIMYPSLKEIESLEKEVAGPAVKFHGYEVNNLRKVVDQDPLAQLYEEDKTLVWEMRSACQNLFPSSLPKLLQSVAWNNHTDVAQMYVLLNNWRQMTPEVALELLDYQYADIAVRNYAVMCLEVLSDERLLLYLLQLVQVLKFEPYLDCSLGRFLLRRAFMSKTIGHYLFWHLRSEMHVHTVSVRFGLMLEVFCRGVGHYMKDLSEQLTALTKMKHGSDAMQAFKKKPNEEAVKSLYDKQFMSAMENIISPLDPTLHCKKLKAEKCDVMDSKMKPLWLVFQNQDTLGSDILQIFKNGDDLRQDMLTLQIMGLMDSLWKQSDLDLKMNPYQCLSTGNQVGMIEVVLESSTIAKIQKKAKGAKGAFDKKVLYQWLKVQNKDASSLEKAVQNFTYSCAGCCVATYVLGIGDRHSDNIMLRTNGQLVHIDFGHFLGNFKSKFGVKRERVPFVLTDDFIYVITKGGSKESQEFQGFKLLCEDAFLKLREHGALFVNLFTMMLSCGIPELRTRDDICYIRDALCLGETNEVALETFRKKLSEAVRNAWSVSLNWYIHNVVRAGN